MEVDVGCWQKRMRFITQRALSSAEADLILMMYILLNQDVY